MTDWTGEDIKWHRRRLGLSRQQMADALGVSHGTIGRWEAAKKPKLTARSKQRLNETIAGTPEPGSGPPTWTGREINQRRINHGLSRKQLADAIEVEYPAVHRWEQMDRPNIGDRNADRLQYVLPEGPAPESAVWSAAEIKRRRQLLKLTQGELAEQLGASRRSIVDWEKGVATPGGKHLVQLQQVLRLPREEPSPLDGRALRDAGFEEVLLRLVELCNEDRRHAGRPPLLQIGDVTLPQDLPEHYSGSSSDEPADRVNLNGTHQDDTHSE